MSVSRWSDPTGEVAQAFDAFPAGCRRGALRLRRLIFEVSEEVEVPVTEALRWGQPAYLAPKGTTLRVGAPKLGSFALFAHCQSRVIPDFRTLFPTEFQYEGNRAVLFDRPEEIQPDRLACLIRHALTYHMAEAP